MIDIDFIRRKIYKPNEEELKIMPGDEIPLEVMNILKDGHYKDRELCFGPGDPKTPCVVHLHCTKCGIETTAMLSKTGTLNYLRGTKQVLCDVCCQKEKEDAEREERAFYEEHMARCDENTNRIISQYINTSALPNDDPANIWRDIGGSCFDGNKVATAIKALSYKTFLQTPYWKAVSYEAKRKAGFKCKICNSTKMLSTHHRTYDVHGYEHTYRGMGELVVLCQDCHAKFHDKLVEI